MAATVTLLHEPPQSRSQNEKAVPIGDMLCSQQRKKSKRAVRNSQCLLKLVLGYGVCLICSHAIGQSKSHDHSQCPQIGDAYSSHKKAGKSHSNGQDVLFSWREVRCYTGNKTIIYHIPPFDKNPLKMPVGLLNNRTLNIQTNLKNHTLLTVFNLPARKMAFPSIQSQLLVFT